MEVVDPRNGASSLLQRNATASVHPTSATTPAAAQRESAARFQRAERETVKLTLHVVGDPTLRAKEVIEVCGISALLSGKYYVTSAKHAISSSGYTVELKVTRDGGGRRGAGGTGEGRTAPVAASQGGEPNRAVPPSGGELTAIEQIDLRTGAARVGYRRDGRAIGGEDPEARMSVPR